MSDYSQMSDWELSEHIAKLRGYTVEEEETYWPNREMMWRDKRGMKSHEPRYANDMNQAVELLRECGAALIFNHNLDVWHCAIHHDYIETEHANPARAIAECWLQWRREQKP